MNDFFCAPHISRKSIVVHYTAEVEIYIQYSDFHRDKRPFPFQSNAQWSLSHHQNTICETGSSFAWKAAMCPFQLLDLTKCCMCSKAPWFFEQRRNPKYIFKVYTGFWKELDFGVWKIGMALGALLSLYKIQFFCPEASRKNLGLLKYNWTTIEIEWSFPLGIG